MILHIETDASYLSLPNARSKTSSYFYLSDKLQHPNKAPTKLPTANGPILATSKGIKNIVGSAAEAEIVGVFEGCQEGLPIRKTLQELKHEQPPTPLKTDNKTAQGIITSNMKPRKTRAMDMRYHWIRDRVQQGQFNVYWKSGLENLLGDYFSKKHCEKHHRRMRKKFLLQTARDKKFETTVNLVSY